MGVWGQRQVPRVQLGQGRAGRVGAWLQDPRAGGVHEVPGPPQAGKEWDSGINPSPGPEASPGEQVG